MGSPKISSTQESMNSVLQAYTKNLPGVANAAIKEIVPTEQAKLAGAQAVSPGYAQLNTDLFGAYGPQLAKIGSDINAQNSWNTATGDLNTLLGPGGQLATTAQQLQKQLDPEYFASRAAAGNGMVSMLNGMDPNKLTPNEIEAQVRGLSQVPGAVNPNGNPSMTSAISNAGAFGDALNNKRNQYMQALQTATGGMGSLRSGVDALQQAVGKPSASNLGDSKFVGAREAGGDAFGMANNFLTGVTGMEQQRSALDANRQTTSSALGGMVSSY